MSAVTRQAYVSSPRPRFPFRLWEETTFTATLLTTTHLIAAIVSIALLLTQKTPAAIACAFATIYFALSTDRFFGLLPRLMRTVRSTARLGGWYWPWRRPLQVGGVLVSLLVIVLVIQRISRLDLPLALIAAALFASYSLIFVLLRSISLHEFDMILFRRRRFLSGRTLHPLLELVGPLGLMLSLFTRVL